MLKRLARATALALVAVALSASVAFADAPNGNSGHSDAHSNQCQNGQDHCPPFGP